ncbi:Tryptophan-associated membrane protein [Corynebacterium xerosis]|uniref:Trp biosynthesis-associated membrane protein n=1 Tax=Brachybacterium tyrofermentans TaxID=47848 RepID=UPI000A1A4129|nr:Tryptophan-associated membrane protein [Corynebacterium xerosis]
MSTPTPAAPIDPQQDRPQQRTSGRRTGARPGRAVTVLAGTVFSGLLIGATRLTWAQADAPDLTGSAQSVAVTGTDAAPAVLALAIVAIAASLATSLASSWVRFVTGPVLIVAGLGAAWSSFAVTLDPQGAAAGAVTEATGVVGSQVDAAATAWPLLAILPALVLCAIGVVVLLVGGRWPRGTRYRSAAVAAPSDPAEDPAAAWDALTRGEDPSAGLPEPEAGPPAPEDGAQPPPGGSEDGSSGSPTR